MADVLLTELERDDPGALQRLRAYVPRHANATSAATAELRDARLIIARELGFPTWRELVSFTEKSRRDLDERQEKWRRLRRQAKALRALDVLLGKATDLNVPLIWAARSNRVEYVSLLLDAGADPGIRILGATPLENAIHHGNTEVVDLLAEHAIAPRALWTYAACGRLDLVRTCFDADGRLRPDAASARPNLADAAGAGFLTRLPPTDDPEEIVGEAFVHACQHGRIEVVRWFLDRGVDPDVAPYLGRTGLHWAIPLGHLEVIRLLLERGADPSIRDDLFQIDADGWLHMSRAAHPHDPVTQQIHDLIATRSR